MRTVIGLDYGTQAARAVLVDAASGETLLSHAVKYPHGVMPGDLASAQDYQDALDELLTAVTPEEYRQSIAGICVDATSLTLVCTDAQGRALSEIPGFETREQAQIKLWKRHAAQPQADEALALAKRMNEPFLGRTGGTISCEWTLPKLMEIWDKDPEVWKNVDAAMDLCEYLTLRLTGVLTRSAGSMSFKGLWARDLGLPSKAFLDALRPGLGDEYARVMRGEVLRPGQRAGFLKKEYCERYGLREDVAVAAGALDGHTALVALGALGAGDAALVLGTSSVLTIQTESLHEIEGICGIALDGLTCGLYGIDSGQAGTGDMLDWYMKNAVPEQVVREATERRITPHQLLAERIQRPWENRVIAADWWNGSRNAPCDLSLPGTMTGMTLATKPEEIYLALLQAIVCGTGEIIDQCARYGVRTQRLLVTGGIAGKNPLLMQEYANLLNLPVSVGQVGEGPALGAAIFAAVAAGLYSDPVEAHAHMGVRDFAQYRPDACHRQEYDRLYRKNHALREAMVRLNQI